MRINELGDLFPLNNISTDCYFMENYKKVDEEYKEINYCMNRLKVKEYYTLCLGRLIRAKQRIELLKVPTFLEIIEDGLENNYSVVVFVNYKETQDQLLFHMKTSCRIAGGQTMEERQTNIDMFQTNKSRIIISTIQAGGVGISLHDLDGHFPRMSVISPTWSGQDLVQCLGRIHRAGGKSPVIQKIVYCAKSYEVKICEIIEQKLKNISSINDGDLYGPMMEEHELNAHLDLEENKYEVISFDELNVLESTIIA
jgi:superfamily II DNA or RNA helicase